MRRDERDLPVLRRARDHIGQRGVQRVEALRTGRCRQAASAIHGECSKANPIAATNVARSAAFNAAMLVIAGPVRFARCFSVTRRSSRRSTTPAGRSPTAPCCCAATSIEAVGPTAKLTAQADDVFDARGLVLLPGLICTHHHFYQTLTRNMPQAQDAELFDWLVAHYPIWARLTPEAVRASTATAIAELLLSGCTTAADHGYIWPNGARVDDQIAVAREMGLRFHASRGSMSRGRSQGGLPPDEAVEDEDAILRDCERVIREHHDPSRYAMTRIVIAPCSPFSVTPELMRASAELAREHEHVHLHTHLCETVDEETAVPRGVREAPGRARGIGRLDGTRRMVRARDPHGAATELARLGRTRTGVAHCPTSNMRLGSGIAPVRAQRDAGMRVGLGVDGSASNDGSHMLDEARHAMLLQRVAHGASAMTAREALRLATRGGAEVLGRDDIGAFAPGMAADVIGVRVDSLATAGGSVHDPLASLVFCRIPNVDLIDRRRHRPRRATAAWSTSSAGARCAPRQGRPRTPRMSLAQARP